MFEALGRVTYRRRRWIVALALAFLAFAAVWGTQVFGALQGGGFEDPDSESSRAAALAEAELGRAGADVVVLYSSDELTVDDPAFREAVTGTLDGLPGDAVVGAVTYYGTRDERFVSEDRSATYAVLELADLGEGRGEVLEQIEGELDAPGLTTQVGGGLAVDRDITERVSSDIATAETISMPILLVLLVVIFGSVAAASLPLAIGVTAILGAFAALRAITYATDVSIFAVNLVTILGLGLAIDYGLFVVSRFREEIRRGGGRGAVDVEAALARTMATAGRTVAVSGVTVAVSLAGLLIFPQVFLRSMGFGGIAAVVIAMVAALTLLPALLAMLGPKVDAWSLRPLLRRLLRRPPRTASGQPAEHGAWARIAHSVMRRPVVYTVVVVALLVTLALPFLRVQFGGIDERVLPAGTESRVVTETIDADFPADVATPITAVVTLSEPVDSPAGGQALQAYVDRVAAVDGVQGAQVTGAEGTTARVAVAYDGDPIGERAKDLVSDVRDLPAPEGGAVLVGGQTATLVDLLAGLGDLLPWMALMVVVATFVLLFLAFGSLVLPVKAVVMNVLSLGASFGALVWIFQDGNLSGFLNFTPTGTVEATQPILVLAIVFGLSMDYEVFLMSRIREQYDLTGDNTAAVAAGVQRTGGIITSAALLLLVVIGAFSLSGITFIKMIGIAMLIAVVIDATVVRMLLVPATMRLLGRANWWAPGPLGRLYARYGIRESDGDGRGGGAAEQPAPPPARPPPRPAPRRGLSRACGRSSRSRQAVVVAAARVRGRTPPGGGGRRAAAPAASRRPIRDSGRRAQDAPAACAARTRRRTGRAAPPRCSAHTSCPASSRPSGPRAASETGTIRRSGTGAVHCGSRTRRTRRIGRAWDESSPFRHLRQPLPGSAAARTLSCMARSARRTAHRPATRSWAWPLAAALLLTGCTGEADGPGPATTQAAPPPEAAPRTAVADPPSPGAALTAVDLAPPGDRAEVPLDVGAAPDGGAHVLLGEPPLGPPTRLVTVTAGGTASGSVAVRGLTAAWDQHLLDDGTVLVSGTLASENAAGWLRLDPDGEEEPATVAAVPLAEGSQRVEGFSAVSDDGRTLFLYVLTTVEGRTAELVEAWDLAGGELLAARDLFADVRGIAAPFTVPDPVSLVALPDGGVALVTNIWRDGAGYLPVVLTYDDGLSPTGAPLALGSAATDPTARVAARGADGRVLVVLRGSPYSTLVAVHPDGREPVPLVAVPGFGATDRLSLGPDGDTALLAAPTGARLVDLATGRTTPVDVGCPAVTTVTALAMATSGRRALVLGGCPGAGSFRPTLWIAG